MSDMIDVKIAVLVGSNGKVSAQVFKGGDTDWGLMADCIMDWPGRGSDPLDPDASVRYVIIATVPRPKVQELVGEIQEVGQ